MQQVQQFDLVVVGGGTAGALSAITAARSGLRVAVADRATCLGGTATNSGLTEINAVGFRGKAMYRGLQKEIFDQMIASGDAEYRFAVPMSSNAEVKIDRLAYNPEALKLLLEEKAAACGVELFYGLELCSANETDTGCTVSLRNRYSALTLHSRYLIDGTGNAELVSLLGGKTRKTDVDKQMINTLMFRLSGVDKKQLEAFVHSEKLCEVVNEGFACGVLKSKMLAFTPIPGSNDVSLNVTRARCDYEDPTAVSKALVEARTQILPVMDFIRSRVPGVQHAAIAAIAAELGVREARTIAGRYTLTADDLTQMRRFDDSIAFGSYPIDIHDPKADTVVWKMLPGVYYIPYRSLLPKNLHRTMAAGKCLDAERQAFAAVRVMSSVMCMGESAGHAVALAAARDLPLDELTAADLQSFSKELLPESR